MSLQTQLVEDMKHAMKAHDPLTLGVVRYLRSAIKNVEIDEGELDDAGVQKVIAYQVKQTKESITEYEKGGRMDLVDAEKEKLAVMEKYLPSQLTDDELQKIVNEVLGTLDNPEMGPAIGQVMKRVAGKADGGRVSQMVKAALS